jgi:isoquinoline 1-oxidoreductase alpha subunit
MTELTINGKRHELDVEDDMPLLWLLRDELKLMGTKFGCGIGVCGACTIHLDGKPVRSCVMPVSAARGKSITTIEGLGDGKLHPVQQAWIDEQVPQCGYCQPGHIMAAAALLESNPDPSDEEIRQGVRNLCRCGTYLRIFAAVRRAAGRAGGDS